MSDEPEERLRKLAEHHSNIAKLLTCPICLDLLISPTRTKCGHVFCQACLEGHIKKGKKGKASCPLCNTQGLTKRALESDAAMTSLVTTFRKLLQSEKNDTGEAIDFMAIRVQRKDARESAATPPRKLPVLENLQTDSIPLWSSSDEFEDSPFYYKPLKRRKLLPSQKKYDNNNPEMKSNAVMKPAKNEDMRAAAEMRKKMKEPVMFKPNSDEPSLPMPDSTNHECICLRPLKMILCVCSNWFVGRVRTICPVHPQDLYLLDVDSCKQCNNLFLKEYDMVQQDGEKLYKNSLITRL